MFVQYEESREKWLCNEHAVLMGKTQISPCHPDLGTPQKLPTVFHNMHLCVTSPLVPFNTCSWEREGITSKLSIVSIYALPISQLLTYHSCHSCRTQGGQEVQGQNHQAWAVVYKVSAWEMLVATGEHFAIQNMQILPQLNDMSFQTPPKVSTVNQLIYSSH